MSNANTNVLSSVARNSSMRTIHIDKDSQPVTLPKMASVDIHSWKIADLLSLVSDDFPLDFGAAV